MFSKIPLLIVCIAAVFSTCNKNTDFGSYIGTYKPGTVSIDQLPSFSECVLASNLKLSDNIPFILKTPLNQVSGKTNQFSLEFNTKYNSSKVSVVGIEWKVDGKISPNESTNLNLKMTEGKEYDIVCSVYSTDYKSVYKRDIEFCASKKLGESKLKLSDCRPVNIQETGCSEVPNNNSKTSNTADSKILRAIAIIMPFSKNETI